MNDPLQYVTHCARYWVYKGDMKGDIEINTYLA